MSKKTKASSGPYIHKKEQGMSKPIYLPGTRVLLRANPEYGVAPQRATVIEYEAEHGVYMVEVDPAHRLIEDVDGLTEIPPTDLDLLCPVCKQRPNAGPHTNLCWPCMRA
jgi:hypothetical protein